MHPKWVYSEVNKSTELAGVVSYKYAYIGMHGEETELPIQADQRSWAELLLI